MSSPANQPPPSSSTISYPRIESFTNPFAAQPPHPDVSTSVPSKVVYPDILVESDGGEALSIDRDTALSPSEGSEEVLVSIPSAIAHLIDSEQSIHLASGEFSLLRLTQKGNAIAVIVKVGKDLRWPLTKDEAAVKVDPYHYFFSLQVPSAIEEACRNSAEEKGEAPTEENASIINYGVSFAAANPADLKALDECLNQYCCFTVRSDSKEDGAREGNGNKCGDSVNAVRDNRSPGVTNEAGSAAYWTTIAPNVEDYSSSAARSIAAGAGHIIKAVFWCSEKTIKQLNNGDQFMKGKLQPQETSAKISPKAMRRMQRDLISAPGIASSADKMHQLYDMSQRVQKISVMSEEVATGVLSGVLKAAAFVTKPLVNSKAGQKLLHLLPGEIALASFDAFEKLFDALEVAGKNVLTTTSTVTTGLVSQRYGTEAGEFTRHGLSSAGHFLTTAWTVSRLRKAFSPSVLVKSAVKSATGERKQS